MCFERANHHPPSGTKSVTRDRGRESATDTDDDAGESYAVRDQIVAEEPALWDPPFTTTATTTPSKPKTPVELRDPPRNRAARRSSPILGVGPMRAEDDQQESPTTEAKDEIRDKQKQNREEEDEDDGAGAENEDIADEGGVSQKKYTLDSIVSHRPRPGEPNIFELLVRWASSSDGPLETWEPEENLHHDAPRALFAYWRRVGGREAHMQDPTLWYIESVRTHRVARSGRVDLSVSWVGSPELNWEREERVEDIAPEVLQEYWEEKGGRENCLGPRKRKGGGAKKGVAKRTRK